MVYIPTQIIKDKHGQSQTCSYHDCPVGVLAKNVEYFLNAQTLGFVWKRVTSQVVCQSKVKTEPEKHDCLYTPEILQIDIER